MIGFLNYVVYQRPRYKKLRKANPDKNWLEVIFKALRFSFLPKTKKETKLFSRSPSIRRSSLPVIPASSSFTGSNTGSETKGGSSRKVTDSSHTGTFDDEEVTGGNDKISPGLSELEQLDEEDSVHTDSPIELKDDMDEKDPYESLSERLELFQNESLEI